MSYMVQLSKNDSKPGYLLEKLGLDSAADLELIKGRGGLRIRPKEYTVQPAVPMEPEQVRVQTTEELVTLLRRGTNKAIVLAPGTYDLRNRKDETYTSWGCQEGKNKLKLYAEVPGQSTILIDSGPVQELFAIQDLGTLTQVASLPLFGYKKHLYDRATRTLTFAPDSIPGDLGNVQPGDWALLGSAHNVTAQLGLIQVESVNAGAGTITFVEDAWFVDGVLQTRNELPPLNVYRPGAGFAPMEVDIRGVVFVDEGAGDNELISWNSWVRFSRFYVLNCKMLGWAGSDVMYDYPYLWLPGRRREAVGLDVWSYSGTETDGRLYGAQGVNVVLRDGGQFYDGQWLGGKIVLKSDTMTAWDPGQLTSMNVYDEDVFSVVPDLLRLRRRVQIVAEGVVRELEQVVTEWDRFMVKGNEFAEVELGDGLDVAVDATIWSEGPTRLSMSGGAWRELYARGVEIYVGPSETVTVPLACIRRVRAWPSATVNVTAYDPEGIVVLDGSGAATTGSEITVMGPFRGGAVTFLNTAQIAVEGGMLVIGPRMEGRNVVYVATYG